MGLVSGFVKGLANGLAGRDFHSVMRRTTRECGLRLHSAGEDHVLYLLPFRGEEYELSCERAGDNVRITLSGRLRWVQGYFPAAVSRYLAEQNDDLERMDWKLMNGRVQCWLTLVAGCRTEAMDGELLLRAAGEMVTEMCAFETALRQKGLA